MAIKVGEKDLFPYLGDYGPVSIYKGEQKLAGYKWAEKSGQELHFDNTYNSFVEVEVDGQSYQDGDPTPDMPKEIHSLNDFDVVSQKSEGGMIDGVEVEKGRESTPYSPAPEDITENDNHPLIDKINLSLNEPLRGVGDIKDRLFKDSDGLWKIERNVGEEVFENGEKFSNSYWYARDDSAVYGIVRNADHIKEYGAVNLSHFPEEERNTTDGNAGWLATSPRLRIRVRHEVIGATGPSNPLFKEWLVNEYNKGTPLTIVYEKTESTIEPLDQELQGKLNALKSFKDSNYVYTVLQDDDLTPTIHAKTEVKDI